MDKFRDWATDVAKMMFREDEKSSFRNLPKSTRLSILLQLSFIWSVIFSIYVFQYETMALGFGAVMLAHALLIFAVYYTFKQFHKAEKSSVSVFKSKNYDPSKIMVIIFVILFMFVFSKGVEVLTKTNSYSIPYDGPAKSALEKWLPFTKGD